MINAELNNFIADKVMGFKWQKAVSIYDPGMGRTPAITPGWKEDGKYVGEWNPAESWTDAGRVMEKMRERNIVEIRLYKNSASANCGGGWREAETGTFAITRVALAAAEGE